MKPGRPRVGAELASAHGSARQRRSGIVGPALMMALILALILGAGTPARSAGAPPAPPPAPFTDVTEEAGVTFVHSNGATGEKLLPETMGGGVAFFDYDGDGDPDLLFVDSAGEHTGGRGVVLYRNEGGGRFRDVTDASGLSEAVRTDPEDPYGAFYGMGAAAADYDGDGWTDLYLTAVGPNRLLRNRRGVFEDVTEAAGVAGAPGREDAWSTGATFFDADGDGDLDLVVGNYLEWSPELDRDPSKVAERTVATASRVRPCRTDTGCGEVLTYGRPQTYRGVHPFLFVNEGPAPGLEGKASGEEGGNGTSAQGGDAPKEATGEPGGAAGRGAARAEEIAAGVTFREAGEAAGLHVAGYASGEPVAKALAVAPVDVDRDGRTDLFVANDTTRNLLFHNRGPGDDGLPRFQEVGELWGLAYDPDGNTTGAMGVDWGYLGGGAPQAVSGGDARGGSGAGSESEAGSGDGAGAAAGGTGDSDRESRGDLSILVGNYADEPTSLYTAQGDPTFFADDALPAGLSAPTRKFLTFGLLLLDYDLDGRVDLLQANGHVEPDIAKIDPAQSYRQPAQLFWNGAAPEPSGGATRVDLNLVEVPPKHLGDLARPLAGRGATYADVDLDGDLDVVLTQIAGPPLLLRNYREADSGLLAVRLRGLDPNRQALGAVVELETDAGRQRRELQPVRSYLSQVESGARFAASPAAAPGAPARLLVTWPGDGRESPARRELRRLDLLPMDGKSRTLIVLE